jgi:hypothetical protein
MKTELSLTDTLANLGYTHQRAETGWRHRIYDSEQHLAFIGDAMECWEWLRNGCPRPAAMTDDGGPTLDDTGLTNLAPTVRGANG